MTHWTRARIDTEVHALGWGWCTPEVPGHRYAIQTDPVGMRWDTAHDFRTLAQLATYIRAVKTGEDRYSNPDAFFPA